MDKKFKKYYWWFIVPSTVCLVALITLFIKYYTKEINADYSLWIGFVASLFFSLSVSFIVQIINDNSSRKSILNRKKLIRQRELTILTNCLSSFLSMYHWLEKSLLDKYKIKESLVNNNIDANIVKENMKLLNTRYSKANSNNKELINNYLMVADNIKKQYNELISKLQSKRIEFENINIDLNFEIFSQEEIKYLILIPLVTNSYNENTYLLIKNLINIVKIFDLKIDYDSSAWMYFLALMLTYNN